jgi:hypothetical protein
MKRAIVSKIALLIQSGGQSQVDLKLGLVVEEVFELEEHEFGLR